MAAIAAVAAVDAVGGWWILRMNRNGKALFDFFDENNYEVFEEDKTHKAIREQRLAECGCVMNAYEIPVDDETTEADFVK